MYCLINVEQEGKFLSIYFSFIFSFWFFALGSGCTIYISDLRKFYPAIVPSLYVSAKFRAPPKKNEKKTAADRSAWGLVSSRLHRLIVTEYGVEIVSLILYRKRPRFGVNKIIEETQPRPQGTFPWPASKAGEKRPGYEVGARAIMLG